ncbi:MAG: Ppx/GppA family phosphatase [Bryobacterales bacterium]|nr:Ppx/GppA family phosphatase [Bryobacterales bacterium]MBV9398922.1 Ppx/GppA family phosphatase [Bryobacterales bacterium]
MLAAEASPSGEFVELISSRRVVRLGESVFRQGRLDAAAMDLACDALAGMAGEYRKLDVQAVRAVGTAALRDATNRAEFLARAAQILGVPVEVISGLEEARLIHLGVQARWPQPRHRLLITDIGGGSAELIFSENGHMAEAFSKPLGAVRLTAMFLKSDPPDPRELGRMERYIQERIAAAVKRLGAARIERMIATSATAAAAVCAANGVRRSRRDMADRFLASAAQIQRLYTEVAHRDLESRTGITGIGPRRAEIIVAGVAVLHQVMRSFSLPRVYYSTAGVRDGIIADLATRRLNQLDADQRRLVRAIGRRYGVDPQHARKVAQLAANLFEALEPLHRLPPARGRILEAAAYLYNIGHYVNDSRHHKHSLYLVVNTDMPGFSDREHLAIANLCRYHRKSMPQSTHPDFQIMDAEDRNAVVLLAPLLRLAVAFDQSQEQKIDRLEAASQDRTVEIRLLSSGDTDIEQWHASQVAGVFREVYGRQLIIRAKRIPQPADLTPNGIPHFPAKTAR